MKIGCPKADDHCQPLLKPMSEIAGRLSVQEGAKCLENPQGGRGVLLGGVPPSKRLTPRAIDLLDDGRHVQGSRGEFLYGVSSPGEGASLRGGRADP